MFGIEDMIKGMWWDIAESTTFPLADLLENLMNYFSVLSAKLTGSDILGTANGTWRGELTEYAMWIAIAIFTIIIGLSLATGNFNNTKKFLRNMMIIASIGTFLYIPVNVVGGMLTYAMPCVSKDSTVEDSCQSSIGDNFTINLLRPYVYRINADGKKIDSNGKAQGTNGFDENKVYNVLSGADSDTNALYFGDVNDNANFSFEDKDIKDLKSGDNYIFDPTLKGKITSSNMEFTYNYNNIIILLFGNLVLLIIFIMSIVKLILRLLNLIAIMFYSPFTLTFATFQGSQAYKALFSTMMTNLFAILLQILYFMFMASLIGIVTSASTGFGPIFALIGLVTVGIFMFDGPDELKKIFGDIDLGANGAGQAYVAGKAGQALGKAGAKTVGAVGNVLGINEASKSIAGGMRNSRMGQGHQGMKNNINEAMFGAGAFAGAGASNQGANYQEWKEQQQQRKNGGWSKNQPNSEGTSNKKPVEGNGNGGNEGKDDFDNNKFTSNESTKNPNQTVDLEDIENTKTTDTDSESIIPTSETKDDESITPTTETKDSESVTPTPLRNTSSITPKISPNGPKVSSNGKEFNSIGTNNGILGLNQDTGEVIEMKEDINNPGNYQVSSNGETIGTTDKSGNITTLSGEDGGHISDYGISFTEHGGTTQVQSNGSKYQGVKTQNGILGQNLSTGKMMEMKEMKNKPGNYQVSSNGETIGTTDNKGNVTKMNGENGGKLTDYGIDFVPSSTYEPVDLITDETTKGSSNDIIEPIDKTDDIIKN